MDATFALGCVGPLLAVSGGAVALGRTPYVTTIVYLSSLAVSAVLFANASAFVAFSTFVSAQVIPHLASHSLRRGPAWDCGYADAAPATQYTADRFARPLRRVFGEAVFLARERVHMPPGDLGPSRLEVRVRDLVWEVIYAPINGWISVATERLNHLQFLTVRKYLSLVFAALISLLLAVSVWG